MGRLNAAFNKSPHPINSGQSDKMHQAFIELNEVPTKVICFGRWIEENGPKSNPDIVLCVPGNPGLPGYYKIFLETIYNKLNCPVWVVGHAGHNEPENPSIITVPPLYGNEHLYDLQGQVNHKVEFFKKYIPEDARVHLIGHSVGAYIILEMLKHPEIKSKVVKSYLLFPTIDNMVDTPNGKFLTKIIKHIVWLVVILSWIFTLFPRKVQNFLLFIYFIITGAPKHNITTTRNLIKPGILQKVFYMAFDEMNVVRDIDEFAIDSNKRILKFYYGATDNWAPISYCNKLKDKFPDVDAEICVRKFDHAFVLRSSENVANMVVSWIAQNP